MVSDILVTIHTLEICNHFKVLPFCYCDICGNEDLTHKSNLFCAFVSNELLYLLSYLTRFIKYTLGVRSYHTFACTDLASVENILGFVPLFT